MIATPQDKLPGEHRDAFGQTVDVRDRARSVDLELDEWHYACALLAERERKCRNLGQHTRARAWAHLGRVALNAREQRYLKWLREKGLA